MATLQAVTQQRWPSLGLRFSLPKQIYSALRFAEPSEVNPKDRGKKQCMSLLRGKCAKHELQVKVKVDDDLFKVDLR